MPNNTSKKQHLLRTRAHSRGARSVDVEAKTFDIIISTETPVRTWIQNPNNAAETIEVDEVLLASGLDYSRTENMPLIDCHDTFSGIKSILGMVENVREVGTEIHGTAVLNSENSGLIHDIERGHYNQISAGYGVNSYEIEYRDGDVPLAYATSWTLYEASLVAVGADPNASVRSGSRTIPSPKISFRNRPKKAAASKKNTRNSKRKLEKRNMEENEIVELIEAAEAAAEIVEEAFAAVEAAIEEATDELPDEILERARKLRNDTDEEEQRGKRNDDEDDKKEEDEIRSIRSIAKSYGLTKAVDDLVALGTRSKDLKASIRSAIMRKAMSGTSGSRSDIEPRKRSAAPVLDTSAIYARRNGK
ncbi:hypothetical protein [Pseudochrobactrum asaccharolyticum]|uniref:hypothetical protein n=1 Tax=Pseudochrobactrum asaccharolyticum TaxID=354351 RepID=UPI00404117A8